MEQERVAITHFYGIFERWRGACEDDGFNWRELKVGSNLAQFCASDTQNLATFVEVGKFSCGALQDAGLVEGDNWGVEPDRVAVICGTSKGRIGSLADWGPPNPFSARSDTPFRGGNRELYSWGPEWAARNMAGVNKISGPWFSPSAACASGAHALALGAQWIQSGRADVVLAGAVEFDLPELIVAAYKNMGALSKSGLMRPFDRNRDGFLPREGAAYFVLEAESHAKKRGAKIHGFLSGYSLHCDAHHMTSMSPGGKTIARAIENALQKAGNPKIDYINAHGTATANDLIEARAIASVFGDSVPVSSTKPLTGHLLGASGAVEAALCLLAMRDGFAPPTLNLETPENDLGLDLVRGRGREMEIRASFEPQLRLRRAYRRADFGKAVNF